MINFNFYNWLQDTLNNSVFQLIQLELALQPTLSPQTKTVTSQAEKARQKKYDKTSSKR